MIVLFFLCVNVSFFRASVLSQTSVEKEVSTIFVSGQEEAGLTSYQSRQFMQCVFFSSLSFQKSKPAGRNGGHMMEFQVSFHRITILHCFLTLRMKTHRVAVR